MYGHGPQGYQQPHQNWGPPQLPPSQQPIGWLMIGSAVLAGVAAFVCRGGPVRGILVAVLAMSVIVFGIVGRSVRGVPAPFVWLGTRALGRHTVWLVALALGGVAGRAWNTSLADRCTKAAAWYDGAKVDSSGGFVRADQQMTSTLDAIDSAEHACDAAGHTAEGARLRSVRSRLANDAPDIKRKAEEEAAAAREKKAVETFPAAQPDIKKALVEATKHAGAREWVEAESSLAEAQLRLDAFKGTSVEKDPKFASLQKAHDTQLTAIQPQLDIIKSRGPAPEFIGGCCTRCSRYYARFAKDPDSVECVASTPPVVEGANWKTSTTIRAKNSFGAKVLETHTFYFQNGQVVDMK